MGAVVRGTPQGWSNHAHRIKTWLLRPVGTPRTTASGNQVREIRVIRGHGMRVGRARPLPYPSRLGIWRAIVGIPGRRMFPIPGLAERNKICRYERRGAFVRPVLCAQKASLITENTLCKKQKLNYHNLRLT